MEAREPWGTPQPDGTRGIKGLSIRPCAFWSRDIFRRGIKVNHISEGYLLSRFKGKPKETNHFEGSAETDYLAHMHMQQGRYSSRQFQGSQTPQLKKKKRRSRKTSKTVPGDVYGSLPRSSILSWGKPIERSRGHCPKPKPLNSLGQRAKEKEETDEPLRRPSKRPVEKEEAQTHRRPGT